MALGTVGTPVTAHSASASTLALPAFTASGTDLVIVVGIAAGTGRTVTGIADTAGLTWVFRAITGGGNFQIEEWYARAPIGVSSTVITVTLSGAAIITIHATAFSGVRVATSAWEQDLSLPGVGGGNNTTITPITVNTTTPDTIVLGMARTSDSADTGGSGWTVVAANNNFLFQFQIVSAAQTGLTVDLGVAATPTAQIGDALVIDGTPLRFGPVGGSPVQKVTSGSSIVLTYTAEGTNLAIFVGCFSNGQTVSSISDTAGLVWKKRANTLTISGIEYWWAKAPSGISADNITITLSASTSNSIGFVFAVAGARITPDPFDQYNTLPKTIGGAGTVVSSLSVSTKASYAIILGIYRSINVTATAGSGFGLLIGKPNLCVEYQIETLSQSGLSVPLGGANTTNGGIADAIVASSVPWVQINATMPMILLDKRL